MKFLDKILDAELEEKFFKKTIFISIVVILLIVIIVFLNFGIMKSYKIPTDAITKNDDKVNFIIDDIMTSRKYIEISGWAYRRGKNVGCFNNRFIIKHEATGKYYALNTDMTYKAELYSMDEGYDCRRSGMYAKGIAIGLPKGLYQIYIEYKSDDENIVFDTGKVFKFGG